MKSFRLIDNLMGWLIFAVAAWTYCSTIEPTASFWDCPEFITTGYKLEVGHPPGAPFFMLTANLFSQFVSDPSQVAMMVNMMSALFSALCILFLYWSISHLVRRLICTDGIVTTTAQLITTQASAAVGALAYTWSDTFWFSAVEGEVYAYSSLFTAVVVWMMLKWEDHADEPHSDRWLVLIAYMTGLSIGVHLLNLLCLPALVLIYYYRKYPKANLKGSLMALLVSFALVGVVLYGIVPGIVKVGGWFELFFVNQMGLGFNAGLIIYLIVLVGVVVWAIWESNTGKSLTRGNVAYLLSVALLGIPFVGSGGTSLLVGIVLLAALAVCLWWDNLVSARFKNTSLLCMLLIMVGYSSYAVIVIRSTANTPMDQNSPEDIFTLGQYLNREQYGDRPLLYGQVYNSPVAYNEDGSASYSKGAPIYQRKEKASPTEPDKYVEVDTRRNYHYQVNMLFPRMYSGAHAQAYEDLVPDMKGRTVTVKDYGYKGELETKTIQVPTFFENLKFFFSYQINYMYMRYFMWNFAGRQNDVQGYGELEHGNWLTGIDFLDTARLGNQNLLPDDLRHNPGRNVYYCLPLLLGLIGIFWQIMRSDESVKQFWVVFFLFFMTGLAIVLYLNQTPQQPRERDYAYAGSFYAFAIWIGLGVAALTDYLNRLFKKQSVLAALIPCICILIPIQMAGQNWDDHDRSGRYACRDFGQNYLMSLSEKGNPIIFTNGDNDTFPLWYNQETEGFRTDARVCNLSYLATDWYIDQMKRPAYDSPSVPIAWDRIHYVTGTNELVRIYPGFLDRAIEMMKASGVSEAEIRQHLGDNPYSIRNLMDKWVLGKDPFVAKLKTLLAQDENLRGIPMDVPFLPSSYIEIPIDTTAVRKSGMMIDTDSIPSVMTIELEQGAVYKSTLMMYEMLAGCNWTRPLYIAITVGQDNYPSLVNHLIQEGLAYRIAPFVTKEPDLPFGGRTNPIPVDTEKMYDNLMHKFKLGNVSDSTVYLDETVLRMCMTHRRTYAQLINSLLYTEPAKAARVLAKIEREMPGTSVRYTPDDGSLDIATAWLRVGRKMEADRVTSALLTSVEQYVTWYTYLDQSNRARPGMDELRAIYRLPAIAGNALEVVRAYQQAGDTGRAKALLTKTMRACVLSASRCAGYTGEQYASAERIFSNLIYNISVGAEIEKELGMPTAAQHAQLVNQWYQVYEKASNE